MAPIFGSPAGELLSGTNEPDVIYPGGGVDNVQAGGGDDEIVLTAPLGAGSTINGGADFDTLVLRTQPGVPYFNGGTNTQYNAYFPTTIFSLEAVRYESSSGDFLSLVVTEVQRANAGLNTLIGGAGRDSLYDVVFTPGTYTMPALTFTNWNSNIHDTNFDFVTLFASSPGNYVLNAREGLATIQGLQGNSGNDILNGSSGSDALNGGTGLDQLFGNGGDDILIVENLTPFGGSPTSLTYAGSTYNGGSEEDALVVGGRVDFQGTLSEIENIYFEPSFAAGSPGASGLDPAHLILSGTNALTLGSNAQINGNGTLEVNLSTITLFDASAYRIGAGFTIDIVINGTVGNDTIYSTTTGDTVSGNNGDDTLAGGDGNDSLDGGIGNDTLRGDAGDDEILGGDGWDTLVYRYDDLAGPVSIDMRFLTAGTHTVSDGRGGTDTVSSMEILSLTGTSAGDTLWGSTTLENQLYGNGGNDTIVGGNLYDMLDGGLGDDNLSGGGGNDTLIGGGGRDAIDGGTGNDTIYFSSLTTGVQVNLANGKGKGGDAEGDSYASIENVFGSGLNDILTGNAQVNRLNGWAGNDVLNGGGGADILWGGTGADLFRFSSVADIGGNGSGDIISDFEAGGSGSGTIDRIDLSAIDAVARTSTRDDAFRFIGSNEFSGKAGELRVQYGSGYDYVMGDTDGNGIADFALALFYTGTLDATDFLF